MSSSEQESQIGFIGVGVMGRPMARRLIEAGHSLIVYDRDEHAVAELAALGARGGFGSRGGRQRGHRVHEPADAC